MILGTEARCLPALELLDRILGGAGTDRVLSEPEQHRDRGRHLSPRLYPATPFDPREPRPLYAEPAPAVRESM
jgi:hypothetical protein